MMKKLFLKIFAVLAVAGVLATSCTNLNRMVSQHSTDTLYLQTPDPMEVSGDVVRINISGSFAPDYFHRRAAMVFQPEIQHEGGTVLLRPVTLRGESVTDVEGMTIPRTGGRFTFSDEVPFTPELADAELVINPVVFPARRARRNAPASAEDALALTNARPLGETPITRGVNTTSQMVDFAAAEPSLGSDNYVAPDNLLQRISVFFPHNSWNLNLNYATNRTEQARAARAAMDEALRTGKEIVSVSITGWASPEGELARNTRLGVERSRVGERFIRNAYRRAVDDMVREHNRNLPRGERRVTARDLTQTFPITVDNKGEDWDGFMAALRASNVRDRDAILRVIETNTDRARREQEMRNMVVVYPELEQVILPPLRRTEIVVEMVVPARTNEEIIALATSNPSELSVEELLFAATLTQDRTVQMQIFVSATQIFPNDWRGFNNIAMLQIQDRNFSGAATNLQRANSLSPNNGHVMNNLGVVALNNEDFDGAKTLFTNARERGNAEAGPNLGKILIKEGDYNGAVAAFGNRPGDLNLALAQILSGDLPGASQTLAAAQASPKAFYLRAIVAARQNNVNGVVSNLRQTSAAFRTQARTDVEFRNFRENADFQNAVR
ncbi:MAG: hypothetical protein FWC94_01555 [Bacteroidales bacterium]|nr:hypothetical protein [Bacteroidales bacterium]